MNWDAILNSKLTQVLGVSLVFIGAWYLTWSQLNIQIQGRFSSQDARIEHMGKENSFYREIITGEQDQRKTLFAAIEEHLKELTKRRPTHD